MKYFLTWLLVIFSIAGTASPINIPASKPLPKIWQIVWEDNFTQEHLRYLKSVGVDGVFKCVNGAEWRQVERIEGQYDWTILKSCLDNAYRANIWFIPEVVINIPPDWFVERYPESLLKDSRGITSTHPHENGAPYLLSPWFIASGMADSYLEPFVDAFIELVSQYPNVPAVMLGNFKLNVLPWKMGFNHADDFQYWPIWDNYAKQSYAQNFGAGVLPPATWNDYATMSGSEKSAFEGWLITAMSENLQYRFLPWLAEFDGWRVINVSIWDNDGVRGSIFTTQTPSMIIAKQEAMKASGVSNIIINDDNMGDCGLKNFQQADINLAHQNGFLIYGERVLPEVCTWEQMYQMWESFNPRPDGFINIGSINNIVMIKFRALYGPAAKPLLEVFLPLIHR